MGERPSSPSCEARQGESITKYRKTEVGLWRWACWSTIVAHILYTRAPLDIERFRQSRHTLIALHFVQTSSDQKKNSWHFEPHFWEGSTVLFERQLASARSTPTTLTWIPARRVSWRVNKLHIHTSSLLNNKPNFWNRSSAFHVVVWWMARISNR
jgi:hypothetical protein